MPGAKAWLPLLAIVQNAMRIACFLHELFFCSRWWDTPVALVGHPARGRQESARNDVGVHAARSSLARQNAVALQLGEMARHGALGQAGDGGELAAARPALAGLVGEPDEALQREVQMPANGAVQVEADGDVGEQKGLRGCSATRPEAADFGHTLSVHAKGAC